MMDIDESKLALDKIIGKARVHFYKPIQVAEILYRHRTQGGFALSNLERYRNESKKWRDSVSLELLGRTCASSARYQDNLFEENALTPDALVALARENEKKSGIVEAYVYRKLHQKLQQVSSVLAYCQSHSAATFQLKPLLELFREDRGMRRSIDKMYEIVVYALFSALVERMQVQVEVSANCHADILNEFADFSEKVLQLSAHRMQRRFPAKIYRVGSTNAADRGIDMFANFGVTVQVKHLSLTEELAETIVSPISADRIIIVCRDSEKDTILSLLTQIGWKSRIQSVVIESELIEWYDKALRGKFASLIGQKMLDALKREIEAEFPASANDRLARFLAERGYDKLSDAKWQ